VVLAVITGLAGLTFLFATANAVYLARYSLHSRRAARRIGSASLAVLSAALTSEALLFGTLTLLRGEDFLDGPVSRAALLTVRAFLLVATAFISLLIWRQSAGRG
jgi:hypothetical protein